MTRAPKKKPLAADEGISKKKHSLSSNYITLSKSDNAARLRGNTPEELRQLPQWVMWRYINRYDKKTQKTKIIKKPFTTQNTAAAVDDPKTWTTFDSALRAYETMKFDGIGFVFTESDPFFGVDLDNKDGDPEAPLLPEHLTEIKNLATYAERSPSGTGAHIIGKGNLVKGYKRGSYEAYAQGRFFTFTGDHIRSSPLTVERRQDALNNFVKKHFPPKKSQKSAPPASSTAPPLTSAQERSDDDVLEALRTSRNGEKIDRLLSGIWSPDEYPSQSEADLALVGFIIAETRGDEEQTDRIFRGSGLYRAKWDEMRGDMTYGQKTIAEALRNLPLHSLLDGFNNHFAVTRVGRSVVILEEIIDENGHPFPTFMNEQGFKLLTKNYPRIEKVPAAELWLQSRNRRTYKGIVFSPGQTPPDYYNLWQGFSVKPIQGKSTLFWNFVRDIICDGDIELYTYVRKFLAHMVQRPQEIPGVALVLRGAQGTGKNTFVEAIGKLVGPHFVSVNRMEQLTGRFNSHFKAALLVHANEASWGGNKSDAGQLKAAITDAQVMIEPKGVDAFQVANYMRLIVSTNEAWPVLVEVDDRRFLALNVSPKRARDDSYFKPLHQELESGGHEAIMYELLNEPLGSWHPRQKPASPNDWDLKLQSGSTILRWAYDALSNPRTALTTPLGSLMGGARTSPQNNSSRPNTLAIIAPAIEIDKDDLHAIYYHWCQKHERHRGEPSSSFYKELGKILDGQLKETRPRKGDRQRVIKFTNLRSCRRQFEKHLRSNIHWSRPRK